MVRVCKVKFFNIYSNFKNGYIVHNTHKPFETGHTQAQSVASFMRPQFTDISIINDLCGIPRVVSGKYK